MSGTRWGRLQGAGAIVGGALRCVPLLDEKRAWAFILRLLLLDLFTPEGRTPVVVPNLTLRR